MPRFLFLKRSLQTKLLFFFLLVSLGPMLILMAINNYITNENVIQVGHERLFSEAESTADHLELYFTERQSDVRVFASLADVRNLIQERSTDAGQDGAQFLQEAKDAYQYNAISVLDSTGTIIYSTNEQLIGENHSQHPEVQQALAGNPAISNVAFEPDSDVPLIHYTSPVLNEQGGIIGLIDARSTLDALRDIIGQDTDHTGVGSYGALVDQYGIRLVIPKFPELELRPIAPLPQEVAQQMIASGRFGSQTAAMLQNATSYTDVLNLMQQMRANGTVSQFYNTHDNHGETSESVLYALESMPWFYTHRVPTDSFYSLVNEQQSYALWTTLLAALIAIGAIIWFSNTMLKRPLAQLLEGARSIEQGDLGRRLDINSQDEIGKLAGSFNTMAESLEARMESEQQAQAEAQRLHQTEAENRQFLEEAVAAYLGFVRQVAQGDLTRRLTVQHNGNDYHGGTSLEQLGNELNSMVERLHSITSQVQEASNSIASSATEILAATTQQASSASQQSSAVTETSTTVEQVKSIAHELSQQAAQAAQDSQSALQKARQGMETVEETVSGMSQIKSRVESIAQTILVLSEQTQAIGTITTTVSELADQSNLLALNAAIEAARAGEQGKSFAVVAQQVRELAERSKHATEQVQDILDEIQRATNAAVMVTEEGTKGVETGSQLAGQAGQMIHEIAEEVEAEAQTNLHMAEAAHQQTVGMGQVGQAMLSIQQATNQSLSSTRQAEQAAQDMHKLAKMLQQAVAVYRLN